MVFLLLAGGVGGGGYITQRRQNDDFRAEVAQRLSAVAELKVAEVTRWRRELISDAMLVSSSPVVMRGLQRLLSGERAGPAVDDLRRWLKSASGYFQCEDILLLDLEDGVRLSVLEAVGPAHVHGARLAARTAEGGGVVFSEPARAADGRIHIDVIAPLVMRSAAGAEALGAVVLRVDPVVFLYPLVQSWPTPSPSAETYLVRREGDEVLYLNEVRHRIDTALSLRRAVADEPLGAGDGGGALWSRRDYRGTPVVAVARAIPDSPWILVAKQDAFEALAPLNALTRSATLLMVLLMLGAASATALLWRHGWAVYYRRLYQDERERQALARRNEELQAHLLFADRMASIGTLAAGVAHEINNPLACVAANLTFAVEKLDEAVSDPAGVAQPPALVDAVRESLRALREAALGADRVSRIVNDLKTFSRTGKERRAPLDVVKVLRAALNIASNEIKRRALLVQEIEDLPPVVANEHRLGQVFLSLLINATQAIPEGSANRNTIRVSARLQGPWIAVEVQDTGCGMTPEVMARIFDPFFTTKPTGVGTGLSLFICHGIVASLGGEVSARSEPGKGSTFRVLLPPALDAVVPLPEPLALDDAQS